MALGEGGGGGAAQGLRPGGGCGRSWGQVSLPSARGSVLEHANFSTLKVLPHLISCSIEARFILAFSLLMVVVTGAGEAFSDFRGFRRFLE